MKKIMKEKNHVVSDEELNKEFLSQFKKEADVSKFLKIYKRLHVPDNWNFCFLLLRE